VLRRVLERPVETSGHRFVSAEASTRSSLHCAISTSHVVRDGRSGGSTSPRPTY
jgi:hypothetical protein